jgi:cystathionine gamma-synthase
VSSYDLLQNPLWRIDDFGKPMPNDRHAISAAIPTWTQLIAFGNGELIIPGGYPRFVYHRDYEALCDRFRLGGDMTRLFPSEKAAKACLKFLDGEGRIAEAPHGLYSITLAGATAEWLSDGVKLFWQHTGLVISSRRAYDILNEKPAPDAAAAKLEIKARIASLAGVDAGDVYLFPSGMAAMLSAHALVTARKPKTPTVQFGFPYLDTLKLQLKFGAGVEEFLYNSPADLAGVDQCLANNEVAAVFCEAPSNPLLRTIDFLALKETLVQYDIPLIVDDTIGTWENIDLRPYADVTITSLSKFFSGEGNVLAGALVLNPDSKYHAEFSQRLLESYEDNFYGGDAIELEKNSRDFSKRIKIVNANALGVVEFLRCHPAVKTIYYPGEVNRKEYQAIKKPFGGFGGLFTIELKCPNLAPNVYDAFEFCKGPGLGTNFTLISPYTMLTHFKELERIEKYGVFSHQLRASIGIESKEVIIGRFDRALKLAA